VTFPSPPRGGNAGLLPLPLPSGPRPKVSQKTELRSLQAEGGKPESRIYKLAFVGRVPFRKRINSVLKGICELVGDPQRLKNKSLTEPKKAKSSKEKRVKFCS